MKKIISYSLWGDCERYTHGALRNAELASMIYPDWICSFYIGKSVPIDIIYSLKKRYNTELIMMNEPGNWSGMFWRFYPAAETDVSVMISRDTDSRLTLREKSAVDEWLATEHKFHIMRDHPYHATEILGGMWGARNGVLKGVRQMIRNHNNGSFDDKYQVDQNFLRDVIYPMVKDNAVVHDEFFEKKPFPKDAPSRTKSYFVGQVYSQQDVAEFTQ